MSTLSNSIPSSGKTFFSEKQMPDSFYLDFNWITDYAVELASNWPLKTETVLLAEAPILEKFTDQYAVFVNENKLNKYERVALILALSPHISHRFLNKLNLEGNPALLRQSGTSGALLPTGETFLFLVSGGKEELKLNFHEILSTNHVFYRKSVLDIETTENHFPPSYGVLTIGDNFRDLFLYNRFSKPRYNANFPAQLLETNLTWDDFVINKNTRDNIDEVITFMNNEEQIRKGLNLGKHMKKGLRALFAGPSGTGKTLAVTLIGKELKRDVYRVDLSMVVSKYIGETNKNLNALFNTAEDKDWILFFDEGDAIFSRRSVAGDTDDKQTKHSNQEAAFLLQRIEDYNGLVIVATNFKANMDSAFIRRFQCIANFSIPDDANRLRLWTENLSPSLPLSGSINLEQLAKNHRFPAASIIKIIHRASLIAFHKRETSISREILDFCILDEEYNNR